MKKSFTALAAKEGHEWLWRWFLLFFTFLQPASASSCSPPFGGGGGGDSLTILFTGDILLDRGMRHYLAHGGIRRVISDETADFLRTGDVVVGNLECPVTTIHAPAYKKFVFRGDPVWLDSLRSCGFTHLNLANNHSVDQGRRGLADTYQNIMNSGLIPVGADSSMQKAARPMLIGTSPRRVWLLVSNRLPLENHPYIPEKISISQQPMDSLLCHIRELKAADSTAVVIVNLHWGVEHTIKPTPRQQLEAHALIDAGADVIIGHHTHTLQSIETYKGKSIYYSIGNFIFDQQKPLNTQACIVRLRIMSDKIAVDTILIRIDRCSPHIIPRK